MRVAIYVRVSTQEQSDEGYSIAAQKERCNSFVESQGWEITKVYADPGFSAKDLKRPAITQLQEDLKLDVFDVVVVYRLDRLVRSVLDLHQLLKVFEKNNVKFKSVTEVFDTTTAMGKFFITMVGAMAEWERNNLSERVSMGMEQLAREGNWKGGTIGYGHDRIDGKMVIVESEAEIIRRMYNWYINGLSDRKIAIKLNQMGIATRNGNKWTDRKVRMQLINKKNYGTMQYGVRVNKDKTFDVMDIYPPIIDKKTYDHASTLREKRKNFNGRGATSNFYFSGISKCSRCGSRIKGITNKRKNGSKQKRYVCKGKMMNECDMPSFSENLIERNFIPELKKYAQQKMELDDTIDQNTERYDRLKNELDQIVNRRKKWQYAWANNHISDEDFQARMQEETEKENFINEQLQSIEPNHDSIEEEMKELIADVVDNWHSMEDNERKQLLQILINVMEIEVHPDNPKDSRVEIKKIYFN